MDIELVRQWVREGKVDIIDHAELRMDQRLIDPMEVVSAILSGIAIEEHPNHEPLPRMVIRSTMSSFEPVET